MSKGFSEEFLNELKSRCNIVTVINRYVPLEKKGSNYWGRCPFHIEKTPSFCVNETDQFYHCFGCKASGNVFKFLMEMESVSFFDAVKLLADESGVQLPAIENDTDYEQKKRHREELCRCMKETAKHYHENLLSSPTALEYLKRREIPNEMISRFGIGYSKDFNEIIDYLRKKGFSDNCILECGVAKIKNDKMFDAIATRIAFPVINIYGEVVAFSGRTMEKNVEYAKYLNTAETPLFSKSKNLFGINLVKKAKQANGLKEVIIVEGQIDVISLHKAGFCSALASLGTALTVEQARMIKRLSDNVVICYDGDLAGIKATIRGLDILKKEGLNVRVASMPDKMDPDELIKARGRDSFQKVLDNALPLIEYKLNYLEKQYNLNDFDGKTKYVEDAIAVLDELSDVEAEVYLNLIKEKASVNIEFLQDKLRKDRTLKLTNANLIKQAPIQRETKKDGLVEQSLNCIVANILRNKPYVKNIESISEFIVSPYKEFVAYLTETERSVNDFINKFDGMYDEEVGEIVNYLFLDDDKENEYIFNDCIWLVYKDGLNKQKDQLLSKLVDASQDEKKDIMKKVMEISQKIDKRSY